MLLPVFNLDEEIAALLQKVTLECVRYVIASTLTWQLRDTRFDAALVFLLALVLRLFTRLTHDPDVDFPLFRVHEGLVRLLYNLPAFRGARILALIWVKHDGEAAEHLADVFLRGLHAEVKHIEGIVKGFRREPLELLVDFEDLFEECLEGIFKTMVDLSRSA